MQPSLDLSSLEKAHASLVAAMAVVTTDDALAMLKRDGIIQRFEYTFELSYKMLKRYLELTSPSPAVIDQVDFRELLRMGGEAGLIENVAEWFVFRDKRNITSHAYDEVKAQEVYDAIPAFIVASKSLLVELQSKVQ